MGWFTNTLRNNVKDIERLSAIDCLETQGPAWKGKEHEPLSDLQSNMPMLCKVHNAPNILYKLVQQFARKANTSLGNRDERFHRLSRFLLPQ